MSNEMNAQQLIDANDSMAYMAWKAKATDYLVRHGVKDGDVPAKKDGILELLAVRAAEEAPAAAEVRAPPSTGVEVNLKRKYAPHYLLDEDTGEWIKQGDNPQTIPGGLAYLKSDEAEAVLERGQATPTQNTFRQLKG